MTTPRPRKRSTPATGTTASAKKTAAPKSASSKTSAKKAPAKRAAPAKRPAAAAKSPAKRATSTRRKEAAEPTGSPAPILSPDGQSAWNGTEWIPAPGARATVPAASVAAPAAPAAPPPPVEPAPDKSVNRHDGLGIAGLVVGIVAVLFSFIPITFFVAWILGAIALVFGLVARVTKKGKASVILAVIAIAIGIAGLVIVVNAGHKLNHDLNCIGQSSVDPQGNLHNAPGCPNN